MNLIPWICLFVLLTTSRAFADNWGFPGDFRAPGMYSGRNSTSRGDYSYSFENLRRQGLPENQNQYPDPSPPRKPTFDQAYQPPPQALSGPRIPFPPGPLPPRRHPNGLGAPSFEELAFYPVGPPMPPPPTTLFMEPVPYGYGSNSKPEYRADYLFPLLVGAGFKTGIASVVGPLAILGIVGKLIGKGALGIGGAGLLGGAAGSSALSAISSSASVGKRRRRRTLSPDMEHLHHIVTSALHQQQRHREGMDGEAFISYPYPFAYPSTPATSRRLPAIEVASRYLSELGLHDRDILDDLGLTYMGCAGLLDKNNHCLERLACELYSQQGRKPDLTSSVTEKEVASLILQSVLGNAKLDRTIKEKVKRAAKIGQEQQTMCFIFKCDNLRQHH